MTAYIYNGSSLVRAVTNYGIQCGRHNSLLGQNLLFCARLAQYIISGSVNRLVNNYSCNTVTNYELQTASFVHEKASSRLYFTKLLKRSGACIDDMLHFFKTFIRSVLEYACPVWHNSNEALAYMQLRLFELIDLKNLL